MKKGIETKERIIDKALVLFHERGYNPTSMNDIVYETGVKKGNLYFHYNTKEELAIEVLRAALREYDRFVFSGMHGDTPLKKLVSMIEAIVAYHKKNGNGRGCIFGNMALESGGNDSPLADFVKSVFAGWQRNISELIKSSIRAGEINSCINPEVYAEVIISQLEGGIMLSKLYSDYSKLSDIAGHIISELKAKGKRGCHADKG